MLKGEIESKPKYFYLMDSGQEKLYKAECLDIKCSGGDKILSVSYTHLRAHETDSYLVCRLLLEKKKKRAMTTGSIPPRIAH